MQYQLPTGKVITLTIEEYLNLSDNDIQYLVSINAGKYSTSPWQGSSIKSKSSSKNKIIQESLDYQEDSDEICSESISIHTLTVDELDNFAERADESDNEED